MVALKFNDEIYPLQTIKDAIYNLRLNNDRRATRLANMLQKIVSTRESAV